MDYYSFHRGVHTAFFSIVLSIAYYMLAIGLLSGQSMWTVGPGAVLGFGSPVALYFIIRYCRRGALRRYPHANQAE